jgi:hypothetical protein
MNIIPTYLCTAVDRDNKTVLFWLHIGSLVMSFSRDTFKDHNLTRRMLVC